MRSLYVIIASAMLFMFVFVASGEFGVAGPLLSAGYFGVFIYCMFLFALEWRESRKKPNEQEVYRRAIRRALRSDREKSLQERKAAYWKTRRNDSR